MRFAKMHGAGNDYIYVSGWDETVKPYLTRLGELSRRLSDRHFGIGGDGLIAILPSEVADVRMRMFNGDGSEGAMCGNGIRCVGKYVYDRGICRSNPLRVETLSGTKTLLLLIGEDGKVEQARVDMGAPDFTPGRVARESDGNPVVIKADDRVFTLHCVSMGNPHAVTFVDDVAGLSIAHYGRILEHSEHFPDRANIEFVQVLSGDRIRMRVWERGSGETMACGTGACAAAVTCAKLGLTGRSVRVTLSGGQLFIKWQEDGSVTLTGPAVHAFDGEVLIE